MSPEISRMHWPELEELFDLVCKILLQVSQTRLTFFLPYGLSVVQTRGKNVVHVRGVLIICHLLSKPNM